MGTLRFAHPTDAGPLFLHVDHLVEKQVGAGRERPSAGAGVPAFALRARKPALAADHGDGSPEYGARALGGGGAGRLVPEHRAVIEGEVAVIRDGPGTLNVIGLRDEKGRCSRPVLKRGNAGRADQAQGCSTLYTESVKQQ